jgi:hypothetical protein
MGKDLAGSGSVVNEGTSRKVTDTLLYGEALQAGSQVSLVCPSHDAGTVSIGSRCGRGILVFRIHFNL